MALFLMIPYSEYIKSSEGWDGKESLGRKITLAEHVSQGYHSIGTKVELLKI